MFMNDFLEYSETEYYLFVPIKCNIATLSAQAQIWIYISSELVSINRVVEIKVPGRNPVFPPIQMIMMCFPNMHK